jgi:(2Fe-2S) ferredoxin
MKMEKPTHHIFVCASFRTTGTAQGACHKKSSNSLLQYLETELADRDMNEVLVSSTGCLNRCEHGPVMIVYPEGHWYGSVNEEKIDEVLDALSEGRVAEGLLV